MIRALFRRLFPKPAPPPKIDRWVVRCEGYEPVEFDTASEFMAPILVGYTVYNYASAGHVVYCDNYHGDTLVGTVTTSGDTRREILF